MLSKSLFSISQSCIENNCIYFPSLLSSEKFLDGLLDLWAGLVERQSGALVVAGILDYLTFALCAPYR